MTTITPHRPAARRSSEGAASVVRLHEAWRSGALRITPATKPAMTADPLRLDSGIPTLTERAQARHHRTAPHVHLVHRVDTEQDIPPGLDGVAIGYTALPDEPARAADEDLYQAEPIVPVDRALRARVWRVILGAYMAGSVALLVYGLYRLSGA